VFGTLQPNIGAVFSLSESFSAVCRVEMMGRKIAVTFCGLSPTPAPHMSFGHPGFARLHSERGLIHTAERGSMGAVVVFNVHGKYDPNGNYPPKEGGLDQ